MNSPKTYHIKTCRELDWSAAETAEINEYVWGGNYRPESVAKLLCIDGGALAVKMTCRESNPKAIYHNFYDEVWLDSAMEFFFGYIPGGDYVNVEMNSIGTCLIGVGDDREGRRRIDEYITVPQIKAEIQEEQWSVECIFSLEDLKKIFGESTSLKSGTALHGNFYKVGEHTHTKHYGMWNPVVWNEPDFHRPECFGRFIID